MPPAMRQSTLFARKAMQGVPDRSPSPTPRILPSPTKNGTKGSSWKAKLTLVSVSGDDHFNFVCTWAIFLVGVCLCAELYESTAYGKFGTYSIVALNPRVGWWLMELPVTISFLYFFFVKGGTQSQQPVPRLMAAIMCLHYSYRGWLFPFLIRSHKDSQFCIVPAVGGSLVTITHGYLNAKWFGEHGKHLNSEWLRNPRFLAGIFVYFSGLGLVLYHDHVIRSLRSFDPNTPRYSIPTGGFFDFVTCGQYLAELWCFTGFALLSCGPNGLFIVLVSFVNLVPRAAQTTAWYREKFGDEYPDRYHIFPGFY